MVTKLCVLKLGYLNRFPFLRSMEAALSRLKSLSADELREEILKANLKCGPITATTRTVFERKLARALVESEAGGLTATPSAATSAEDGDIGYHLGLNPPEEEPLTEKSMSPSRHDVQTPNQTAQITATSYYGVCPLWEDVLARNGENNWENDKGVYLCLRPQYSVY